MTIPAAVKNKLAMLRESFLHTNGVQDWVSAWWSARSIDERRDVLALADLDCSPESARRPWRQHSQENRDLILAECKRIGRLVEGLRWS